jgi:hypothetical protein
MLASVVESSMVARLIGMNNSGRSLTCRGSPHRRRSRSTGSRRMLEDDKRADRMFDALD